MRDIAIYRIAMYQAKALKFYCMPSISCPRKRRNATRRFCDF